MHEELYSNGKLLITGEYLVLDGALALAVPLKFGQRMNIGPGPKSWLHWIAMESGSKWFEATFSIPELKAIHTTDHSISFRLASLLSAARRMNPEFPCPREQGWTITTELNYPREWGLGSSSTLVANLAKWSQTDPYELLWSVFSGSGYDIACAYSEKPLLYRLEKGKPAIGQTEFCPPFHQSLYFVYLGKKQDSEAGILAFRNNVKTRHKQECADISRITEKIAAVESQEEFNCLVLEHESIISDLLKRPTLNETSFKGFPGIVKSLGAWGGDFALLSSTTGREETVRLLQEKGFQVFFPFKEIVLQSY